MNATVSRFLIFNPVRFLRGERIAKHLKTVRLIESGNRKNIETYQLRELNGIINYAYKNIPYYHNILKPFLGNTGMIHKFKDMEQIPVLTKATIRNNFNQLKSNKIRKYNIKTTSGSTGEPLKICEDRNASGFITAIMFNAYSWYAIKISDKQARFWGSGLDIRTKFNQMLKDFIMNRIRISAFDLDRDSLFENYKKIVKWKPTYFYGYPSLIGKFAKFVESNNLSTHEIKPKVVIVTGELLLESDRQRIERVFKTRVVNEYGCSEMGVIGFECADGNMHLMAHNIFFEVLKNNRQVVDEIGDIYLTELNALTMPLIRYKIGDRGCITTETCSCGSYLPIIKITSGRLDDYIETPDKRKVYDAILAYTFKRGGIERFKAIQKSINRLQIEIEVDTDFNEDLKNFYLRKLKTHISQNMDIEFIIVEKIKREKSGKIRYFKSEL
jgi:phenylacetate-CoA ligase